MLAALIVGILGTATATAIGATQAEDTKPEAMSDETPRDDTTKPVVEPVPLGDDRVLPWNRPSKDAPKPPTKSLSSPREMLRLFSIDESQINQLFDNRPLDPDEEETLLKVLFRIPYFGSDRIEAWQRKDVTWSQLASDPSDYRTEVFKVDGRATLVRQMELSAETASRLEFDHYFQVRFQAADAPHPILVCSRKIPDAWQREADIDERASFYGLFLKTGDPAGQFPELVFAAERVAWMPDRVQTDKGITASHVLLGDLGMDVGLFDSVRETNRKSLVSSDHECFYQLLSAAGRADPSELFQRREGTFELEPMLTKPQTQHGRLITLTGTTRRIQKLLIEEEDIQERFGITHYYEIDMFVPLGDEEVRLGKARGDKEAPVFRNSYPVHCCVLRLPEGLEEGEKISQEIRIAGFYLKLWAYKTGYVSAFDKSQRQLAPLFVATTPRLVERSPANPLWGWIGGSAFLVVLAGLALGVWLYRRSDRRFEQAVLRHQYEVGQGKSLDEMGLKAQDEPDFSGLE